MNADARLAELAVAEREGRLVSVDYPAQMISQIASEMRARALSAAGKWAPRVVLAKTVAAAQGVLQEVMNDVLEAWREVGVDIRDSRFGNGGSAGGNGGAHGVGPRRRGRPRGPRART